MYRLLKFLFIAFVSLYLFSCDSAEKKEKSANEETSNEVIEEMKVEELKEVILAKDPRKIGPEKGVEQIEIETNLQKIQTGDNPLYGLYVGAFGKNKITIAISDIVNDSIYGHSVCAGNFRGIKGIIRETGTGNYEVNMKEKQKQIHVVMTLSTRGCPLGDTIMKNVEVVIQKDYPDYDVDVELVWEPEWTPERITDIGKEALGM
jgi:hypothetical protein